MSLNSENKKKQRKHPEETPGKQLKDEIMKTKIRTFIGLVALGMIGFTSNNATAANSLMSSLLTVETKTAKLEKAEAVKPFEVVEGITEEEFFKAAETFTALSSDKEIEKYATKQIANSMEVSKNFLNDAESFTASGSDKEIAKYAGKQVALLNEKESR